MRCPKCGSENNRVLESREVDDGLAIRRRRLCEDCQSRFTTYERVEITHLMIVKKGGNRESYDRTKLARGIYRAFEKRPTTAEAIELLISRIEQHIQAEGLPEIPSSLLGEAVMDELMTADPVAYVRFASVYRSFTDLASFERELKDIKKNNKE
ncbi:MAG: transcriptional regulator NrdR [Candidatus Saccharibacteria bacterium]